MNNVDLSRVSTADLQAELSRREGVREYVIGPEDGAFIANTDGCLLNESGPFRILVNID